MEVFGEKDADGAFSAIWSGVTTIRQFRNTTADDGRVLDMNQMLGDDRQLFYLPQRPKAILSTRHKERLRIVSSNEVKKLSSTPVTKDAKAFIQTMYATPAVMTASLQEYRADEERLQELKEEVYRRKEIRQRAKSFNWLSPEEFREQMKVKQELCFQRRNSFVISSEQQLREQFEERHGHQRVAAKMQTRSSLLLRNLLVFVITHSYADSLRRVAVKCLEERAAQRLALQLRNRSAIKLARAFRSYACRRGVVSFDSMWITTYLAGNMEGGDPAQSEMELPRSSYAQRVGAATLIVTFLTMLQHRPGTVLRKAFVRTVVLLQRAVRAHLNIARCRLALLKIRLLHFLAFVGSHIKSRSGQTIENARSSDHQQAERTVAPESRVSANRSEFIAELGQQAHRLRWLSKADTATLEQIGLESSLKDLIIKKRRSHVRYLAKGVRLEPLHLNVKSAVAFIKGGVDALSLHLEKAELVQKLIDAKDKSICMFMMLQSISEYDLLGVMIELSEKRMSSR